MADTPDNVKESLKIIRDEVAKLKEHFDNGPQDPRTKAIQRSLKAMAELTECGQTLSDF